jgi:hypothetical protein
MDNRELHRQVENIHMHRLGENAQSSQTRVASGLLDLIGILLMTYINKKKLNKTIK